MSRFEKWAVWSTSALTVLTGVGYFVTKYLVASPDPYAVVNHPLQPWFLKTHVVVSPLMLFALGTIAVEHVWKHYVSGVEVSRRSALITALAVIPMVLTGYLIQVLTDEGWVRAMALSHIVFGALYGLGLALHTWIIREKNGEARKAAEEAAGGPAGERDGAPSPGRTERRPDRPRASRAESRHGGPTPVSAGRGGS